MQDSKLGHAELSGMSAHTVEGSRTYQSEAWYMVNILVSQLL